MSRDWTLSWAIVKLCGCCLNVQKKLLLSNLPAAHDMYIPIHGYVEDVRMWWNNTKAPCQSRRLHHNTVTFHTLTFTHTNRSACILGISPFSPHRWQLASKCVCVCVRFSHPVMPSQTHTKHMRASWICPAAAAAAADARSALLFLIEQITVWMVPSAVGRRKKKIGVSLLPLPAAPWRQTPRRPFLSAVVGKHGQPETQRQAYKWAWCAHTKTKHANMESLPAGFLQTV